MKKIVVSFLVLAVAALLSSALPPEKENGARRGIAGPGANEKKFLSKRKPPGKIPGPQLVPEDAKPTLLADSESSTRRLTEEQQKKKKEENLRGEEEPKGKMVPLGDEKKRKDQEKEMDADKTLIESEEDFSQKPGN